jgi:hypothetical protein
VSSGRCGACFSRALNGSDDSRAPLGHRGSHLRRGDLRQQKPTSSVRHHRPYSRRAAMIDRLRSPPGPAPGSRAQAPRWRAGGRRSVRWRRTGRRPAGPRAGLTRGGRLSHRQLIRWGSRSRTCRARWPWSRRCPGSGWRDLRDAGRTRRQVAAGYSRDKDNSPGGSGLHSEGVRRGNAPGYPTTTSVSGCAPGQCLTWSHAVLSTKRLRAREARHQGKALGHQRLRASAAIDVIQGIGRSGIHRHSLARQVWMYSPGPSYMTG